MRCPYCGHKMKDKSKTCSYCGRSLKVAREERRIYGMGAVLIVVILVVGIAALHIVSRNLDGSFFNSGNQMVESVAEQQQAAQDAAAQAAENADAGAGTIGGEAAEEVTEETEEEETEEAAEEPAAENLPLSAELTEDKAIIDLSGYAKAGVASAEASSVVPDLDGSNLYDAPSAVDGEEGTSWQEGAAGAGEGETLTIHLDREYNVKYLLLKLGSWTSEGSYLENCRPQTMTIDFGGESVQVTFPDEQKEHCVTLSKDVKTDTVTFRLDSAYAGTSWSETCIAEVEIDGY
ncbi:MAG: zinc ribbon domain-containing protein [Eubacterium sp.]|nr:zinc ribbon domain-containing protein [Eubacterium sp.]